LKQRTTKYTSALKATGLVREPDSIARYSDEIQVNLKILILRKGEYFVAFSPSLQLSSYAKEPEDAKATFRGALKIFLEETIRLGTLERLLLKFGWTLKQTPKIRYTQPPISLELLHSAQSVVRERITLPF
jgi:hypothetical protein